MKLGTVLVIAVVALALIAVLTVVLTPKARWQRAGLHRRGVFAKKRLATPREQTMYWRLIEALLQPKYIVLAQVSFGALLNARQGASRYSFSQKIADFVVTDSSFSVLAVIELDDSSHRGKEDSDLLRDIMLTEAGYRVLRYPQIPDVASLRSDLVLVPKPLDLPPMTAER